MKKDFTVVPVGKVVGDSSPYIECGSKCLLISKGPHAIAISDQYHISLHLGSNVVSAEHHVADFIHVIWLLFVLVIYLFLLKCS